MAALLRIPKENPFKFIAGILIGIAIYYLINYGYTMIK